ncbi:CLN3 protein, partial [Opisthorchis viverrini]
MAVNLWRVASSVGSDLLHVLVCVAVGSDCQLSATRSNDPEEYEVCVRDLQSGTGLNNEGASDDRPIVPADNVDLQQQHPSSKVKLRILKDLAGLLIFLSLVYFFEYIINQSLALNFVLCLTQVIYRYIPNIWIILFIILYEGCLGGLSYVNTFYRILQETTPAYREYAMASATISDSIGITFAGFLAIPLRNWLCQLVK